MIPPKHQETYSIFATTVKGCDTSGLQTVYQCVHLVSFEVEVIKVKT
jgi:hypothetical protein